ncbi:hypothetical protein DPMN_186494 [Dreissena polymorpha]|uniref:Uncharacterized protein n=1 Tax=Dreissena polymorpha TaxID=45954 RepID=A0A9D4DMB0_DREPO|nr:hypothetical protein DPMN_186494 [Dreissena polymorpha]
MPLLIINNDQHPSEMCHKPQTSILTVTLAGVTQTGIGGITHARVSQLTTTVS